MSLAALVLADRSVQLDDGEGVRPTAGRVDVFGFDPRKEGVDSRASDGERIRAPCRWPLVPSVGAG